MLTAPATYMSFAALAAFIMLALIPDRSRSPLR